MEDVSTGVIEQRIFTSGYLQKFTAFTKLYQLHNGKGVVTTAMRKRKCNSCGGTGITVFDFNNDAIYSKYCNGNGRTD
ncbi:MAG: hypothetical protein GEU26_11075 [Nitrososphaeraceae archaeon]|jgi:DnaJ-class molecular chaperone|nr:hypothetical protein [Nitrososphaeraceae archaeon]